MGQGQLPARRVAKLDIKSDLSVRAGQRHLATGFKYSAWGHCQQPGEQRALPEHRGGPFQAGVGASDGWPETQRNGSNLLALSDLVCRHLAGQGERSH